MLSRTQTSGTALTCRRPILVLGVGNILLRDEGVGVRVVEAMERMDLPPDVELFDGATAGFDLLDVLADRRKVIVVDAIDFDCEPGTVVRLEPEDIMPQTDPGVSQHEAGLMDALAATRLLGIAPDEVIILGVKPKSNDYGLELSSEISGLLPDIVDLVLAELETGHDR